MKTDFAPTAEELEFAKQSMPVIQPKKIPASQSKWAPTQEEMEFASQSMSEPISEEVPWYKSVPSKFLKELTQGTISLGESFGGLMQTPQARQEQAEQRQQVLEKALPSEEGLAEEYAGRAGKLLPASAMAIATGAPPIPVLAATGVAAGTGTAAKKLGFGELGQTIAETLPFLSPNLSARLIGINPRQQQAIDLARRAGATEAEIAPALHQENYFRRFLSRLAYKGETTQDRLENSRRALGNIYEELRTYPGAQQRIQRQDLQDVMQNYAHEFYDLPPTLRRQIERPFQDLMQSRGSGEDFIRFFQHVNYETTDPRRIGRFQEVTRQALERINPELGQDFRLANELAHSRYRTAELLRMPRNPDFLLYTKALGAAYGIMSGDYTLMAASIGPLAARKVATELLLNPRYQNMLTKTVHAINHNRIPLAKKTFDEFREQMKEVSPEFYDETEDLDFTNFHSQKQSAKE